jgi:AbrB family looped-hinge helix DNA binding protein
MRSTAIISSKGQIVIPSHLRKRYGMKEGTTIVIQEEQGRLVLAPSNFDAVLALGGSLRDLPLEDDLARERQLARDREKRQ